MLPAVQHHHAHVAAVMAEHGATGPVLGLAFDGIGYGEDGTVWGAEVLLADLARLPPGGAPAVRAAPRRRPGGPRPRGAPRSATSCWTRTSRRPFALALDGVAGRGARAGASCRSTRGVNAPLASSMGRLFDAAAAVLGLRLKAQYEGQAAMELESLAGRRVASEILPLPLERTDGGAWVLDPVPCWPSLGARRQRGDDLADLAADFHDSVAWAAVGGGRGGRG